MINIGKINQLNVIDEFPFGYMLGTEQDDEQVVLPSANINHQLEIGNHVEVFVYPGEQGTLTASFKTPKLALGETKVLKAVGVTEFGAFFDWGMERDLLVPSALMESPINEGMYYVVHLFYDEPTQRVLGATKLHPFLQEKSPYLTVNQDVELLVYAKTDLGFKVVINGQSLGLIFHSDAFKPLKIAQQTAGVIKDIREDGKIDVALQRVNRQGRDDLQSQILEDLVAHGGISTLTDKSPAEDIYARFNVSKGAYKKALGALYKQHKILLDKQAVRLNKK